MNHKNKEKEFVNLEENILSDDDIQIVSGGSDSFYGSGFGMCYMCNSTDLELYYLEDSPHLYCRNCCRSFHASLRKKYPKV